ncbi:MAG: PHP domain-containing protein [Clostridia bacterium]|nr:PHP domain-containing protein [Clostridia bacterium]
MMNKFTYDHDFHIHSRLSSCSHDPEQSPEQILDYAKREGLSTIVLTDHFWDERVPGASKWYSVQDYPHISQSKPLPQSDGIRFLFGCETDMDKNLTLGCSRERMEELDFIVVPTTHFHMTNFTMSEEMLASPETRAEWWVKRIDALLTMDLPFHKIGLAHMTCGLIWRGDHEKLLATVSAIPDYDLHRVFEKAAKVGMGIELNVWDMRYKDCDRDILLRPYRIAKDEGCKFYCGTDAHTGKEFENVRPAFERGIADLGLTEDDKLIIK